ncbi:MAG: phosphodiester glycosidase family protein [Oscillatoriales cyanobacterium SM2_2_1]|nr:phosphodiester glycosidase family protein [Oscillatoriales cyanobacterium SM2_2_1]
MGSRLCARDEWRAFNYCGRRSRGLPAFSSRFGHGADPHSCRWLPPGCPPRTWVCRQTSHRHCCPWTLCLPPQWFCQISPPSWRWPPAYAAGRAGAGCRWRRVQPRLCHPEGKTECDRTTSKPGELLWVTIEPTEKGIMPTLSEAITVLKSLGAMDALNLDGGSSTAMTLGETPLHRADQTSSIHNVLGLFLRPPAP